MLQLIGTFLCLGKVLLCRSKICLGLLGYLGGAILVADGFDQTFNKLKSFIEPEFAFDRLDAWLVG